MIVFKIAVNLKLQIVLFLLLSVMYLLAQTMIKFLNNFAGKYSEEES